MDTSTNVVPPIAHSRPATSYKSVQTKAIATDVSADGIKTTVYKDYIDVVHTYNNKGVLSTTNHTSTFCYVI